MKSRLLSGSLVTIALHSGILPDVTGAAGCSLGSRVVKAISHLSLKREIEFNFANLITQYFHRPFLTLL
jgi:hypothetical protein